MKIEKYDYPMGMQIELTGRCNLKCFHCYNSSGEAGINDLSDEEWLRFIDSYFSFAQIPQINFTGGECLLRKKLLLKIIERIAQKNENTKIVIMTNGCFVNDDFINSLANIPNEIHFQISLDGSCKEEHEAVRRVNGSWEKALDACLRVVAASYHLGIASVVTTRNINNIRDLFNQTLLLGAETLGIGPVLSLGRAIEDKNSLGLSKDETNRCIDEIKSLKDEYDRYFLTNISYPLNNKYYAAIIDSKENWFLVNNLGGVKVSPRLPLTVGNILNSSPSFLWQSVWDYFSSFKQSFLLNQEIEKAKIKSRVES